jgi:hypothetical protein
MPLSRSRRLDARRRRACPDPSAFFFIFRSVRSRGEFGDCNSADCGFIRQQRGIDLVVVDDHRQVEEPSGRFSHRSGGLSVLRGQIIDYITNILDRISNVDPG